MNYQHNPPLAQASSLFLIQNSLYIPHTALLRTAPSLLERGNGGEDSTVYFKSLRKAKILKKLLIEKYFISLHSKKQNKLSYVLV